MRGDILIATEMPGNRRTEPEGAKPTLERCIHVQVRCRRDTMIAWLRLREDDLRCIKQSSVKEESDR